MAARLSKFSFRDSKAGSVYLFGLTAVIAATALRLLAEPVFGSTSPYIVYILPIICTAAYGGFAPGLFATISSALVIVLVFFGGHVSALSDARYLFFFLLDGLYISWLGEQLRRALDATAKAGSEAETARASERAILTSISEAFGSLDERWRFVHANDKLVSLTGKPLTELLGREIQDVWPELAESPAREELQRAVHQQVPVRMDVFVPRLSRWYETRAYPQAHGLCLFCLDITDRKHADQMLRESEERLRLAPEAARIGTWTCDLAKQRFTGSLELEQIFGLAPGSLAGKDESFLDRVYPDDRLRVLKILRGGMEQPGPYEIEFRYLHASGATRWMLGRGQGASEGSTAPSRIVGIFMDITEQKRNEEQLRHTQKLESLGILAGGIAHDFNNLLVGITGNASLVSDLLPGDHPLRNQLGEIVLAGEKAAHLTRQMLAYAGKGRFVVTRLEIGTLIRDAERLLRLSVPKYVDLRLDLQADPLCVEADAGQLQQLIMNLVINAAEAIPDGQPGSVFVRTGLRVVDGRSGQVQLTGQEIAPGEYVALEVQDTGIGMDESTQAKIFEPFFTTKFVGRGLGLAAVLGIVRSHQGALSVTSAPGLGTTFQVLLPVQSGMPVAGQPKVQETNLRGEGAVLVVDDESCVRNLAQATLESYGYTVLTAEDASAALNLLLRTPHRIAVVLLDLSMPGMGTREAIKHIQTGWPDLRIILSSGYDEEEVLARLRGIQLDGFVQKPYTPARLAGKIKAAMAAVPIAPDCAVG